MASPSQREQMDYQKVQSFMIDMYYDMADALRSDSNKWNRNGPFKIEEGNK